MSLVKFICTKDDLIGDFDSRVTELDAWTNFDLLNEFFGTRGPDCMCTRDEYFNEANREMKAFFENEPGDWTDYVIMENDIIVSRAAIWRYSNDVWEVAGVSTRPDCQGKGYGSAVVRSCAAKIIESGKKASCTTGDNNTAMINTALKVGFKILKQ